MSEHLTTRREFLRHNLALVGTSLTVPAFLQRSLLAAALQRDPTWQNSHPGRADDRILIVLQLAGGNDGLNTVVPFRADPYYRARPRIAVPPEKVLRLNDELGLHPAAAGLRQLFDDAHLAIVQQVGYPNPSRSHFRSMAVWDTASPEGRLKTGWLGRYFDNTCRGADPPDPRLAIALTEKLPPALRGERFQPLTTTHPDDLQLRPAAHPDSVRRAVEQLNRPAAAQPDGPLTTLDYLTRTVMNARVAAGDIRRAARTPAGADFPRTPLGRSLELVARLIAARMPARVYYVSLGGFDTHSQQQGRHARLLTQLGDALLAFARALQAQKNFERTTLMTFSEFGRRVEENASGGTDHGEAAPLFVLGGAVRPGLIGEAPDLTRLHRGDLPFAIDFRRVYATLLKDWLHADPAPVFPGRFQPLPLLRA